MADLNRNHGWEISVTTSVKAIPRAGGVARESDYLVLALETTDGKRFLSVVNPRFARRLEERIMLVDTIKEYRWLCTSDTYFSDFPAVRSLRGKRVSREVYEHFLEKPALETSL